MKDILPEIFTHFETGKSPVSFSVLGPGNIHATFLVSAGKGEAGFVLQKINNYVFPDVDALTENILRIEKHLEKKKDEHVHDWEVLHLFPAKEGGHLYQHDDGSYWRLMNFIPHIEAGSYLCNLHREAGSAYGTFIDLLSDMQGPPLKETIPGFHDLGKRLKQFYEAEESANRGRVKTAAREIAFLKEKSGDMLFIPSLLREGKIRKRTTHNDTKLDNILFSEQGTPRAVVDLDTVMPGLVHYDYGDAIRSFTNSCSEDEPDLSGLFFRMDIFESFTAGFLGALHHKLAPEEKESLVYAPLLFAYMQGVRFLTDFLNGDIYYRTKYPEHNLIRTRNQFRLLESMLDNFRIMKEVVQQYFDKKYYF